MIRDQSGHCLRLAPDATSCSGTLWFLPSQKVLQPPSLQYLANRRALLRNPSVLAGEPVCAFRDARITGEMMVDRYQCSIVPVFFLTFARGRFGTLLAP
jgi:hypothetical protein